VVKNPMNIRVKYIIELEWLKNIHYLINKIIINYFII
jgi:hypothetical protein